MKLDIHDIKNSPGESKSYGFDEEYPKFAFMGEEIRFAEPVHLAVTVTNIEVGFLVQGFIHAVVKRVCARCTETLTDEINSDFTGLFQQEKESTSHAGEEDEESEDEDENLEVYSYHGNTIDITDIVSDTITVEISMKPLCREDCRGLCPVCGQNLNEKECSCDTEEIDERLADLKKIFSEKE